MWPEVGALAAWGAVLAVAVMFTAWVVHLRQRKAGIVEAESMSAHYRPCRRLR